MLNYRYISTMFTVVLLSFMTSVTFAGQYETMFHLNEIAVDFIKKNIAIDPDEQVEIKLSEASNQLRLETCPAPIILNIPQGSSQHQVNTLEMTCSSGVSWHAYLPIDMRILTKVVVTRETIPSKTVIASDMLEFAFRDKNALYSGYFKNIDEVAGQTPVTTVVAGTVLTKRNVQQPIIIKRNQSVSIVSTRGNIMVRADGIAKTNGALNDTIQVLNTSSKRIIDARVMNSSSVEVGA